MIYIFAMSNQSQNLNGKNAFRSLTCVDNNCILICPWNVMTKHTVTLPTETLYLSNRIEVILTSNHILQLNFSNFFWTCRYQSCEVKSLASWPPTKSVRYLPSWRAARLSVISWDRWCIKGFTPPLRTRRFPGLPLARLRVYCWRLCLFTGKHFRSGGGL